jgi:hypothetical protein
MTWRHMVEWRCSSTILDFGNRCRWVVSFTPRPRYPRYPLDRRLGGPRSLSVRCGGEKYLALIGNRTPAVQRVPRRYTVWATSTQRSTKVRNKEIRGNAKRRGNKRTKEKTYKLLHCIQAKREPNRHGVTTTAPSFIKTNAARLQNSELHTVRNSVAPAAPVNFCTLKAKRAAGSHLAHSLTSSWFLKLDPCCQNTRNVQPEKGCFHRVRSLMEQSWNFQLEHTFYNCF